MELTVAEELLLIAHNEKTGRREWWSPQLGRGLAGAVLTDLVLAGRIELLGGRVQALDHTPAGDPESDSALERIAGQSIPQEPGVWVEWLRRGLRTRLLTQLAQRGVLGRERQRILGRFAAWRYPAIDSAATSVLRTRLVLAVVHGAKSDARIGTLGWLLEACGVGRSASPGVGRNERKERLTDLAAADWPSVAVRLSIDPSDLSAARQHMRLLPRMIAK